MPSREPLEMTIETFPIVSGPEAAAAGCSSSSVICPRFLDAAARLRTAGDLGRELRRALGEQLVELLDRHARELSEGTDRRRRAVLEVGVAHEADDLPVPV